MARWAPGAADRLRDAALELFLARGFEQTTTAEIAEAAGVTERTFYRHFADKREVLFGGQEALEQVFVDGLPSADAEATPLEMVAHALEAAASLFPDERRDHARRRGVVIAAEAGLRERELLKMASLAAALGRALHDRGVPDPAATLAAESGATVFRLSFERWTSDGETRSFGAVQRSVLDDLRGVLHRPDAATPD